MERALRIRNIRVGLANPKGNTRAKDMEKGWATCCTRVRKTDSIISRQDK